MLILSRKIGQSLMIGDNVEVTLLWIHGGQCRLGISAPKTVAVDRTEIRKRKDAGLPPPSRSNEQYVEL